MPTTPLQLSQSLINALSSYFVRSDRALTAYGNAFSAFASIPALRSLYTMGSIDETPLVYDHSAQGRVLTYNGNPLFSHYLLAPYIDLDGTGDYLSRADEAGLDLLATEAFIPTDRQGITVGGWFWFDRVTNNEGLITKGTSGSAVDGNYKLSFRGDLANDHPTFVVYSAATAYSVTSSVICTAGQWYFIAGRFNAQDGATTGTAHIWVNGVKTSAAADVASLDNSTKEFDIGAIGGANSLLDGKASFCFTSAMALSDGIIQSLYQISRYGYGCR